MRHESIEVRLGRIFLERFGLEPPGPDVDLFDSGLLDSLWFAALLAALEEDFEIQVPPEAIDLERFRTPRALSRLVAGLLAGVPAAARPF
jgi:acyl carrier protein